MAVALIMLAVQIVDGLARRSGPLPSIPQPNGYETLLAVAHEVSLPQGDMADLTPDAIREIAKTNRLALERLHEAVRANTGVPIRIERDWMDNHVEDVKQLKRLAVTLGIQARAATLDGNTNGAARCMLDVVLLGQAIARGGLLFDGINSSAIEAIGAATLRTQVSYLDKTFCRAAAQELEQAETRREQPERILTTEKDWSAANYGLIGRIGGYWLRKSQDKRKSEFMVRYKESMRRTRRLMLILAARSVELETGKAVASSAELVPGVLRSVPTGPTTGASITGVAEIKTER